MAMKVTYPDGSTELLPDAVSVDSQNFHEGTIDFYNAWGVPVRQISMSAGISWDEIEEPPAAPPAGGSADQKED